MKCVNIVSHNSTIKLTPTLDVFERIPTQNQHEENWFAISGIDSVIYEFLRSIMSPYLVAPFAAVVVAVGYFIAYFRNSSRDDSDDFEQDENQKTKIRHEAGL